MLRTLPFALALLGAGCTIDRTLGLNDGESELPDAAPAREWDLGPRSPKSKLDVLFVLDDAADAAGQIAELRARFPVFWQQLVADRGAAPLSANIGVITSDYGAGTGNAPGCQASPGGRRAQLQTIGAYADPGCQALPALNAFIEVDLATGISNLPPGQDLAATFACLASVSTPTQGGCPFQHQLESAYAALHDNDPNNAGFLRTDAFLAVVFVSDKDDASTPAVSDLFDRSRSDYGYEDAYRAERWGVLCGGQQPPYADSGGPLAGCGPAPNPDSSPSAPGNGPGKLYDVSRYVDFFSLARTDGGVKVDPRDVLLAAIDAPEAPFRVILTQSPSVPGQTQPQCGPENEQSNPVCVPQLAYSCSNAQQPVFFGSPAVRLNAVVGSAANHVVSSVCDGDFTAGLKAIADAIAAGMSP